jgi:hypothetical protein
MLITKQATAFMNWLVTRDGSTKAPLAVKLTLACEFLQKWMPIINSTFEQLGFSSA